MNTRKSFSSKTFSIVVFAFVILIANTCFGASVFSSITDRMEQHHQQRQIDRQLHYAIDAGNYNEVERLLNSGADVNSYECTSHTFMSPLHRAAYYGHTDICQLLIDNGADVNARLSNRATPAHYAAMEGHTETLEFLRDNGANMNAYSRNAGGMPGWHLPNAEKNSAD